MLARLKPVGMVLWGLSSGLTGIGQASCEMLGVSRKGGKVLWTSRGTNAISSSSGGTGAPFWAGAVVGLGVPFVIPFW